MEHLKWDFPWMSCKTYLHYQHHFTPFLENTTMVEFVGCRVPNKKQEIKLVIPKSDEVWFHFYFNSGFKLTTIEVTSA